MLFRSPALSDPAIGDALASQSAYGSNELYRQETARLLLQQLLLQSEEENEELR